MMEAIFVAAVVIGMYVVVAKWLLPRIDRLGEQLQAAPDPLRAQAEQSGLFPTYGEEDPR